MSKNINRETWLNLGMMELDKALFADKGYELPEKLAVSCGFPRGSSTAIGQCFYSENSEDATTNMFICPSIADPVRVLDILLHEMIHACAGKEHKHRGLFRKLALEFGLRGKMTSTFAEEGTELHATLSKIAGRLGDYPHSPMVKTSKVKKESSWVRMVSPNEEAYKIVISPRTLEEHGAPVDPWGSQMEQL